MADLVERIVAPALLGGLINEVVTAAAFVEAWHDAAEQLPNALSPPMASVMSTAIRRAASGRSSAM